MCNVGDRIKLKYPIAGSSEYIGYVYAFHPSEEIFLLIHFPGCTFGHDGMDSNGTIHGKNGSKEFYWLRKDEFTVTEQAETPVFTKLIIE